MHGTVSGLARAAAMGRELKLTFSVRASQGSGGRAAAGSARRAVSATADRRIDEA